jgi:heme exporter protein D
MTGGIVVGGWEFVWSAYGLTGTALLIYGVSLIVRLRQARNHANH